ncbi:M23 family metallopeptidase, partial [Candidatus Gracilibacteria bacterium]|nr:M23 family metallopeptidase [Candidatus Gracilibacteria bacterium]
EYDVLSNLLDMKTDRLIKFKDILQSRVNKYSKYSKYNRDIDKNNYKYLRNNRLLKEAIYNLNLINNIIEKRSEKYLVPLSGHKISRELSKIPNAGRPYRADYTDGIHRGWDVDGKFGEEILAIDDGIIIRVVSDFKFSDLDKIKRGENLSDYDKLKNLDILRGNQVWLKTMKGDVIFFSHLDEIFTNIKVGTVVRKGQPIGTIGITGIPDKNYKDFHVHFAIQVNPRTKIGEYDIDDYLNWDWLFKGKSVEYILKNIDNIFED